MTLTEIFKKGMAGGLANSILIKLDQIGTVKLWNASKATVNAKILDTDKTSCEHSY